MWLNFGKNKKMKITQTLRRPANWQDFESLCLLLWREEWKSEDLKKNGRNGQAQNGVDISGHRDGEGEFSGIQCKCKPGNKGLAMDEIDEEINNAKAFKPALRRLVFATTADKDATIEEYVRLKDEENRKKGLFSIDIKSWQDIIDLLERNKSVLNIYLDIVAEDYAVAVTFEDGASETTIHPQYSKIYYLKPAPKGQPRKIASTNDAVRRLALGGLATQLEHITALAEAYSKPVIASPRIVRGSVETNHAFCPLKFMVANQGRTPIDDFKILFFFDNPNVTFIRNNVEKKMLMPEISFSRGVSNVILEDGVGVQLFGKSIIPGDNSCSDDFFVHIPDGIDDVNISWKLLSRHFPAEGTLKIHVEKIYVEDYRYNEEKAGDTDIGDYIEKMDITDY